MPTRSSTVASFYRNKVAPCGRKVALPSAAGLALSAAFSAFVGTIVLGGEIIQECELEVGWAHFLSVFSRSILNLEARHSKFE